MKLNDYLKKKKKKALSLDLDREFWKWLWNWSRKFQNLFLKTIDGLYKGPIDLR